MKKRFIWLFIGLVLIIVGLSLTVPRLIQTHESENVPKVSVSPFTVAATAQTPVVVPTPTSTTIEGRPVRIQLPSLHIDLPIINGYYNTITQQWTLTNDKVQYAARTPLANNVSGNTFLYGHNRRSVFRSLYKIKLGDEAIITTDNGHTFTYTFQGALETTPDDGSLFNYRGKPILTVQTCSGTWYQNRQLFTFSLKEAK